MSGQGFDACHGGPQPTPPEQPSRVSEKDLATLREAADTYEPIAPTLTRVLAALETAQSPPEQEAARADLHDLALRCLSRSADCSGPTRHLFREVYETLRDSAPPEQEQQPTRVSERDVIHIKASLEAADGVTSLIASRFAKSLPADVIEDCRSISADCRADAKRLEAPAPIQEQQGAQLPCGCEGPYHGLNCQPPVEREEPTRGDLPTRLDDLADNFMDHEKQIISDLREAAELARASSSPGVREESS